MANESEDLVWQKVLSSDELPEGRVTSVTCNKRTLRMSHHKGQYGVLDNRCPHQGGPLGEGSIENGLLRCPWHGWDYDPITGGLPVHRRTGSDQPAHRPVGRQRGPGAGDRPYRSGGDPGTWPRRLPGDRSGGGLRQGGPVVPDRAARQPPRRVGEPGLQERHPQPRRLTPDLPRRGAQADAGQSASRRRPRGRLPSRDIAPPADALQAAVDLLDSSKRPVIVVGHGARFQMEAVVALAGGLLVGSQPFRGFIDSLH